MILWRIALCAFFVMALVVFFYGVRACNRASKEERMNMRELHYDADGGFIMIDMEDGHMGIYEAIKPLRHIWKSRLKRISPGVYKLSICEGWIELYNNDLHGVYVIPMGRDDDRFFQMNVQQDIPVLVY